MRVKAKEGQGQQCQNFQLAHAVEDTDVQKPVVRAGPGREAKAAPLEGQVHGAEKVGPGEEELLSPVQAEGERRGLQGEKLPQGDQHVGELAQMETVQERLEG